MWYAWKYTYPTEVIEEKEKYKHLIEWTVHFKALMCTIMTAIRKTSNSSSHRPSHRSVSFSGEQFEKGCLAIFQKCYLVSYKWSE